MVSDFMLPKVHQTDETTQTIILLPPFTSLIPLPKSQSSSEYFVVSSSMSAATMVILLWVSSISYCISLLQTLPVCLPRNMRTLSLRCRKASMKLYLSSISTVRPQHTRCVPLVIVLISHDLTTVPSFLFTTRFAATDQHLNQIYVCSRYFTRAMTQGRQSQSNPLFITTSMISLAICYLAPTWRKSWTKHVTI